MIMSRGVPWSASQCVSAAHHENTPRLDHILLSVAVLTGTLVSASVYLARINTVFYCR